MIPAATCGRPSGSNFLAIALATAALSVFGLTCGLLSLRRVSQSHCMLAVMGVVLWLWMFPQFKAFDHSVSLSMVYFAVLLVEKPKVSRHFGVGIFLGLAAFFGRNHGFYGLIAYFLLILFIWHKLSRVDLPKRLVAWAFGIVIGYLPLLIMVIFIPEFLGAFWNDLVLLFDYGATNIPLPVPWPWQIDYAELPTLDAIKQALTGTLFLVMPVFFIGAGIYLSIAHAVRLQRNPLFVAAAFVGLIYIHYAFSRADIAHLAQGIHPFLLGLMALPMWEFNYLFKLGAMLLLLAASLLTVGLDSHYAYFVEKVKKKLPAKIAGSPVAEVRTIDGVKVILQNEHWILMRPSGTEPLIRTYAEANTPQAKDALLEQAGKWVKGFL